MIHWSYRRNHPELPWEDSICTNFWRTSSRFSVKILRKDIWHLDYWAFCEQIFIGVLQKARRTSLKISKIDCEMIWRSSVSRTLLRRLYSGREKIGNEYTGNIRKASMREFEVLQGYSVTKWWTFIRSLNLLSQNFGKYSIRKSYELLWKIKRLFYERTCRKSLEIYYKNIWRLL